MRRVGIFVGLCVSACGIALWLWTRATAAPTKPEIDVHVLPRSASGRNDGPLRADIVALDQEVRRLRAEVGRAHARIDDEDSRVAASVSKDDSTVSKDESEDDNTLRTKEASEAARHAQLADLQAQFASEPINARWSQNAVSTIRDAAQKAGIALSRILEIDCRSHGCRVELLDESSNARQAGQALMPFVRESGGMFPRVTADHYTRPDQQSSYVLYMGPL